MTQGLEGADGGRQTKQREPVILERASVIGELSYAHKMTHMERAEWVPAHGQGGTDSQARGEQAESAV